MADADWLSPLEKLAIWGTGRVIAKGVPWLYDKFRNRKKKVQPFDMARLRGRRSYGRRWRRRYTRRFKRRYTRRRRRSIRGAVNRVETTPVSVTIRNGSSFIPLNFDEAMLPGLSDYKECFTEFRILSCTLYLLDGDPIQTKIEPFDQSYIAASSYSIAKVRGQSTVADTANSLAFLRNQMPMNNGGIMQLSSVKYLIPNSTTQKMRVRFVPYRMYWSLNTTDTPATTTNPPPTRYQGRPVSLRKWTPISWLFPLNTSGDPPHIVMFGPYVVPLLNTSGGGSNTIYGLCRVRYQVRGQI